MSALIKKLEQLHEQKAIEAIDLERCRFFSNQDPSAGEDVLKAVFLAGYRYRRGDICVSLEEFAGQRLLEDGGDSLNAPALKDWKKTLSESALTGEPGSFTPLILDGDRIYFHKLWNQEQQLGQALKRLAAQSAVKVRFTKLEEGLNRLFPSEESGETDWQKVAAATAALQQLTVISGGPGTGKTTTVVRILALLLTLFDEDEGFDIALAAPTGKAAARLKSSIEMQLKALNADHSVIEKIPEETFTIHRLLGARRDLSSFRFNEEHTLTYDLIVVDEVSMADQRLMNSLLKAIKPSARLILLGDKDQLASVEAGSVLGDICSDIGNQFSDSFHASLNKAGIATDRNPVQPAALTDNVVLLEKNYRFKEESGIVKLTAAIKNGEAEEAVELLRDETLDDVRLRQVNNFDEFWQMLKPQLNNYFNAVKKQQPFDTLFEELQKFIILCAHRRGPFGVQAVNSEIERTLRKEKGISGIGPWYEGRPVIVRRNDYQLGLRNGDIGICRRDENGSWNIIFPSSDQSEQNEKRNIHPERLPEFNPAYALTIHQSQGSEFENIFIVLPEEKSKILSRELLYTAVTRAKKEVTISGREEIIRKVIEQKLERHSGLRDLLTA